MIVSPYDMNKNAEMLVSQHTCHSFAFTKVLNA